MNDFRGNFYFIDYNQMLNPVQESDAVINLLFLTHLSPLLCVCECVCCPSSSSCMLWVYMSLESAWIQYTHIQRGYLQAMKSTWSTCGRDSMLCPLILTTVSEELEVEELTSFTISPGKKTSNIKLEQKTTSPLQNKWFYRIHPDASL